MELPELLKQTLKENLLIALIDILPNTTLQQKLLLFLNEQNNEYTTIYRYFHIKKTLYERKLELEATNITPKTVQKQIHNEFKTAAGPTNTHYKLRAAFRLYDLFNTCENVLQNLILQPIKVQYIGKLTELKFQQFSDQITSIILDHYLDITDNTWTLMELSLEEEIMLSRTNINKHYLKVAESENIGANHLGFVKSLFQQYSQQLGLNSNYYPAKSTFNFYINDKITECLGETVNIEAAREYFYTELFQHTNLPKNYSFTPIIREINQTIEKYTQQQFFIIYADKGKGRLQTPAVMLKGIQLSIWKKQRIEAPTAPSYYYTSGSAINITSVSASISNTISTFGQFPFQNFGTTTPWELSEEKEEEKLEDQEFTYQNPITENPEFETLNLQNQQNLNLINKPQDFNAFKVEFLRYFNNNNSINHLVNTFTTIKQGETETVTTYLEHFHRNLCQIQAIDTNYFTAPQILNQFIYGLCSSILQHVCPLHLSTLQEAVTCARDFKSAESKANHAHTINLVMNESSKLDSKLKQFSDSINQKLEGYLANNRAIYQSPQQHSELPPKSRPISNHLPAHNAAANLSTTSILTSNLLAAATNNLSTTTTSHLLAAASSNLSTPINLDAAPKFIMVVHQLIPSSSNPPSGLRSQNSGTSATQNPNFQNYLSLLVIPEDTTSNHSETNQQVILTSNISPVTVTNNESLAAIFLFELEEPFPLILFSGAALEEKPITAMYTDAKVDGHPIKLILDSSSADSIITKQLMNQLGHQVDWTASTRIITADGTTKTPIGEIDDFSIEVNGIVTPIKILVIEAIQYQALVGNNWLVKTNTVLDWTTQELQLTMCGHFKATNTTTPLIDFKEESQNLPEKHTKSGNGKKTKKIKGKEKKEKKRPSKPPSLIIPTLYHNDLTIVDLSLYASIAARSCRQWAHAVATIRNIQWQLSSIAAHASLNALGDQNI
ncbi:hypothetical protein G9A89_003085 [Geosiphon pyriformis]|nr:hypothetical protein G9A89_003085 [Geosiphon pyriformis]